MTSAEIFLFLWVGLQGAVILWLLGQRRQHENEISLLRSQAKTDGVIMDRLAEQLDRAVGELGDVKDRTINIEKFILSRFD